jgi:phenylpropionate dioxygenase-like ring-hydroxylating dioxygenase large terminal subunit
MIKNMWYLVLDSNEVKKDKPLGVKRLSLNLVFWRNNNGKVTCISDICVHRGAALSLGKIKNNCIQCPYHGFEFDQEGKCKFIPANGKDHLISNNYAQKYYEVREDYGFIWIWYGDKQESYPDLPFFEYLDDSFSHNNYVEKWKTNYTRIIENQLDVSHLAFVHSNTIGRGGRSQVNGPLVESNDNSIKIWVDNNKQGEKRLTTDKDLEFLKDREASLEFRFPNIWCLNITSKFKNFAAFVPIDEENTLIYLRAYQKIVTQPVLKNIVGFINTISNKYVLNQDKSIVESQLPIKSELDLEEKLIRADLPILMYRRIRNKLKNN